ncbi:MAG: 30S ribosomal protein S4 [bacterium]
MAKYNGPVCRLCRREGVKLYLKGERCYTAKCSIDRRGYAPGQHGQRKKKLSEYGLRMREKQKAKRIYGLLEGQFRKYFDIAERQKGVAGENFLRLLERRLDNVVFRLGFADSRQQARQLIRHNHFVLNGRKANIPSMLVKIGDIIEVKEGAKTVKAIVEANANKAVPAWLEADREAMKAKILTLPNRDEIDVPVQESLIVEYYSR